MSSVFIKGQMIEVGEGADEIIRLRRLLEKRNQTIRTLKAKIVHYQTRIRKTGILA